MYRELNNLSKVLQEGSRREGYKHRPSNFIPTFFSIWTLQIADLITEPLHLRTQQDTKIGISSKCLKYLIGMQNTESGFWRYFRRETVWCELLHSLKKFGQTNKEAWR
jgi:hypothetical protein